jgi:hypothetical protein
MGPAPCTPAKHRVGGQARGTVVDAMCRRGSPTLQIDDDDLAIGGDQDRH